MAMQEFRIIEIPDQAADGTPLRNPIHINRAQGIGQFGPEALRTRRIVSISQDGSRADLYKAYSALADASRGEKVPQRTVRRLLDADMGVTPVDPGVNLSVDGHRYLDGGSFILFSNPDAKAADQNIIPVVNEMYVIGHFAAESPDALIPDRILLRRHPGSQPLPSLSAEQPLLAGASA